MNSYILISLEKNKIKYLIIFFVFLIFINSFSFIYYTKKKIKCNLLNQNYTYLTRPNKFYLSNFFF